MLLINFIRKSLEDRKDTKGLFILKQKSCKIQYIIKIYAIN